MPTEIERAYMAQGYALPEGLSWAGVASQRARWGIAPIFVPLAHVRRASLGWGVPFINGRPLRHP